MLRALALLTILYIPAVAQTVQIPTRPHSVNTIWHGSGAPANSLGTNGDFYIDSSAWVIYGPKASSAWPTGVSLAGSGGGGTGGTGATGAQGPQGPQGPAGTPGASATVQAGTATALSYGASPTVTNAGSSTAAVFSFGIPSGAPGAAGSTGPAGPQGPPGAVTSSGTSSTSYADAETPSGTINGTNASFTLANSPNPAASLELVRNGQTLRSGTDYTVSGAAIAFVSGAIPATGDILQAWYRYTGTATTYNYSDAETPGGTINGTNLSFTLLHAPTGTSLLLTRNGITQRYGIDFNVSGATLTFLSVSTPGTGDIIQCWYRY